MQRLHLRGEGGGRRVAFQDHSRASLIEPYARRAREQGVQAGTERFFKAVVARRAAPQRADDGDTEGLAVQRLELRVQRFDFRRGGANAQEQLAEQALVQKRAVLYELAVQPRVVAAHFRDVAFDLRENAALPVFRRG